MRIKLWTAACLLLFFVSACASGRTGAPPSVGNSEGASDEETIDLTVRITGVSNTNGRMGVSLFSSEDGFPGEWKKAEENVLQAIAGDEVVVVFEDLDPGTYAVSVLHDEDENGELNTNAIGIPSEGYGVSNDAVNTFSAPEFREAAFELVGSAEVVVPMHY